MADNEGFREWLAMGDLKHMTSLSSLLMQVSAGPFNKLKEEIKVAITDGSKLALAVEAWTGRNQTKYLRIIESWIKKCSFGAFTCHLKIQRDFL